MPATGGGRRPEQTKEERASPATGGGRRPEQTKEERASPATGGGRRPEQTTTTSRAARGLRALAGGARAFDPSPERYHHNRTGEDNGDAHHKRQIMGREVVVAITDGQAGLRAVGADLLRRVRRAPGQAGAGEDHRGVDVPAERARTRRSPTTSRWTGAVFLSRPCSHARPAAAPRPPHEVLRVLRPLLPLVPQRGAARSAIPHARHLRAWELLIDGEGRASTRRIANQTDDAGAATFRSKIACFPEEFASFFLGSGSCPVRCRSRASLIG